MSYKLIEKPTPNYWERGNYGITEIVIHHWGRDGQNIDAVANWLCNPRAKVSANDVIEAGKVIHLTDKATWHAGNKAHNLKSYGIECRPEATEEDYVTVAERIADIWRKFGKVPLIRHKDIVATACPGRWDIKKLQSMAESFYGNKKASHVKAKSTETFDPQSVMTAKDAVKLGQHWANRILGTNIVEDGERGSDTVKVGAMILQWAINSDYGKRLSIDGLFYSASKKALGRHYVRFGESQYMVTALEILLLLNGYNPHGVELPGGFGTGLLNATKLYQSDAGLRVDGVAGRNTFMSLIK